MSLLTTFGRPTSPRRPGPAPVRLHVETLDERIVPSRTIIDHDHIDTAIDFSREAWWHLGIHNDTQSLDFEASDVLLYGGTNTRNIQPSDPQFAFTGAQPGDTVWILPQSEDPTKIFLGFGFADDLTPGTFGNWLPDDPRVSQAAEYVHVDMVGFSGPGQFSAWQSDTFGNPLVWISTANPNAQSNGFYIPVGDDFHLNWGFTAPGTYQVTYVASAQSACGCGVVTVYSDPVTYTFGIEDTSAAQGPDGGGGALGWAYLGSPATPTRAPSGTLPALNPSVPTLPTPLAAANLNLGSPLKGPATIAALPTLSVGESALPPAFVAIGTPFADPLIAPTLK